MLLFRERFYPHDSKCSRAGSFIQSPTTLGKDTGVFSFGQNTLSSLLSSPWPQKTGKWLSGRGVSQFISRQMVVSFPPRLATFHWGYSCILPQKREKICHTPFESAFVLAEEKKTHTFKNNTLLIIYETYCTTNLIRFDHFTHLFWDPPL